MKTERRHELQTNWLADQVGGFLVVIKPYMKALTGIIAAALVVWVAILFMAHRSAAEEATGWNTLWNGLLGGPNANEALVTLSESNAKHLTGEWASLILADNNLNTGVGLLFIEKSVGQGQIKSALENYKTVLADSTDPLIREHALFGVGRAQESLCKLDEAQAAYEQVRKDYPNGSYSARAKARLDDLARDSTRSRYEWFASLQPPPNVFGKGGDKAGDNGVPPLPPELESLSQFTNSPTKTPPPEPKPDTGAKAPKDSKTGDTKAPATKTPDAKSPDTKSPEKSKTGDKASDTGPAIPKPTDTKAPDTKAPDAKTPDKSTSTTPTTGPTLPATTPVVPTPTTPTPTVPPYPNTLPVPKPDDTKTTSPKPADSK